MQSGALLVAAIAAAAALTGCGTGSHTRSAPADPDTPGGAATSAAGRSTASGNFTCADAATAVPLPTAFPREVPLPSDAVPTAIEERSGGRLVLTAVAPGSFRQTLAYMQQAYPAAGLTLKEGEVEDRDAESNFTGNGLTGRWTLDEISGCHGDTLVTVLVARA
jgi:hypothetical protein